MHPRWLISALAAMAMAATPSLAAETAPSTQAPPAAGAPAPAPPQDGAVPVTPEPSTPQEKTAPAKAEPKTQMAQGTPTPATPPPGQPSAAPEEKQPDPPTTPKFTYGGQADFYFSTNFNDPFNGLNNGLLNVRAWDIKDEHGPHLGLIDLWAQHARDPIGFRIDLNFGPTSNIFHAADPTDDEIWRRLQQLYVSANLDGKRGRTYVDFGKWVTTAGAEVAEPRDNFLYTRGVLFNIAQPFFHLGIRGYHYLNDTDYVMAAVHRGYNAVGKTGRPLGFALAGGKKLNDEWTVSANYYGGVEGATVGAGESYRSLIDLIALYNPTGSKWAYTFNVDYAQQASSKIGGLSAQAKYAINPKSYAAFRGEFLLDDDFAGSNVYTVTAGYTYLFSKYFQARAEYRHDFSNDAVFANDQVGRFKSNQGTFLIAAIVGF